MFVVMLIAIIYALPNYFGEAPAVQVSPSKSFAAISEPLKRQVITSLEEKQLQPVAVEQQGETLLVSFDNTDKQIKARDVVEQAVNQNADDPDYTVALNLVPRSPQWLRALGASPMFLGLDLRGGVHFTLQIDMDAALAQRLDALAADMRNLLGEKGIALADVQRTGTILTASFANEAAMQAAKPVIEDAMHELQLQQTEVSGRPALSATFRQAEADRFRESAVKQNIMTLNNRINELGVAEPVIQQQGADRIVVQLPGVQDTAKAKEILGRTATLEIRLVDESEAGLAAEQDRNLAALAPEQSKPESAWAPVPFGSEVFGSKPDAYGRRQVFIVKKDVLLTGKNLKDAQPGFDQQTQAPIVSLELDSQGARDFQTITRENKNKRLAILLFEKGRGEVVTAPVIQNEIPGGRVQITGSHTTQEVTDTALLLRSGSLAAPMDIVEERIIGPALGAANIDKGFKSVTYGFLAVIVFMTLYYMLFGAISSIALGLNLLLLVAVLSMLQATLTLPGMAGMALTLGMAIDANVLINERIREELRAGATPQAAIHTGYEQAWATILDSNITSLIAGIALLAFGSGAVRGFAVVHCLGILTSMFSAVFFSRGLVNLWYGNRRKLSSLSIGTVWRPGNAQAATDKAHKE